MKKNLIIDIAALAGVVEPSITKKLERYLPDIERYLEQGVRRQIILDHLNAIGFDLTMSTFETMLKRLRKRKKNGKTNNPSFPRPQRDRPPATDRDGNDLYRGGPRKLEHDLTKTIDW
jgi:hypothetical protein